MKRKEINFIIMNFPYFFFPLDLASQSFIVITITHPIGGGVGNALSNPFLPSNQYVFISPLPLISMGPRDSK